MERLAKQRTCRVCKVKYSPCLAMQRVCGPYCARELAVRDRLKRERKAIIKRKDAIITLPQRKKITERVVNAYILARDANRPCISCEATTGKHHAGHYLSVGARPHLRFEELNIHRQCYRCNVQLSGNQLEYRYALIGRIGQSAVEKLENDYEPRHYTHDDLKALAAKYRAMRRELKKRNEA